MIDVAIAIIIHKNKVLISWRDARLHQGQQYEFPGGKIEAQENARQAVVREVREETGMAIVAERLLAVIAHDYGDRQVRLHFYRCRCVEDCPQPSSNWFWVDLDDVKHYPFPAANTPILKRLDWSRELSIINISQLRQIPQNIELCYLRMMQADDFSLQSVVQELLQQQKKIILNVRFYSHLPQYLQQHIFAVHLNHQQLYQQDMMACCADKNIIAACHQSADVVQANHLACDAILFSPVHATATHPQAVGMGWKHFAAMVKDAHMPVYALGGVQRQELATARQYGAYGVAGIRDFLWQAMQD